MRMARAAPASLAAARLSRTSPWRALVLMAVIGVAGTLLLGGVNLFTWTTIWIYGLFALSTNVLFGWTGRASFGQAAFFGIGAYFVSFSPMKSWPAPVAVVAAGIVATVAALIVSVVTRRSSGLSFAILTLVVGQVLYEVVNLTGSLGGETGLYGITPGKIGSLNVAASYRSFALYTIVVVGICVLALSWLRSSYLGLSMAGVRDNARRSGSLGVPVTGIHTVAFCVAGCFAGIAGALFAQQQTTVSSSLLNWSFSGDVVVMCLVGGMYSFWGPALGAALYTWLTTAGFAGSANANLYLGIVLLLVVLVFPGGIAGIGILIRGAAGPRIRWRGPLARQRGRGPA
ncbi:MAG TPA: branched-chain amino acid ABC transporter permease [Streptosporangiaceae bacterium]|nr:branched-chain amino acid ABC transporter permease [Streptosporangiaceae bacterium]